MREHSYKNRVQFPTALYIWNAWKEVSKKTQWTQFTSRSSKIEYQLRQRAVNSVEGIMYYEISARCGDSYIIQSENDRTCEFLYRHFCVFDITSHYHCYKRLSPIFHLHMMLFVILIKRNKSLLITSFKVFKFEIREKVYFMTLNNPNINGNY